MDFESKFAKFGLSNSFSGKGYNIEDNIGIYCLNTALLSSAGFNNIDDKQRLSIDSRSLQKWVHTNKSSTKILLMHHPISWLSGWANKEIRTILNNDFSLCISGHIHDQSIFHIINKENQLIECSAPPLLTDKKGDLGYSIISVSSKGVLEVKYRQWTKNHAFVTGVNFSNTDDGKVVIQNSTLSTKKDTTVEESLISKFLDKRFRDSLKSFSSQPIVWVEPILSKSNDIDLANDNVTETVNFSDFILKPESTLIKAPPQFGLTCLSFFLIKEAWKSDHSYWLYIDFKNLTLHNIQKNISVELELLSLKVSDIACIVLDSWTNLEKDSIKILNKLCDLFRDVPIIVMQTVDDYKYLDKSDDEQLTRGFETLFLLALTRNHIRKVVAAYNDEKYIGDEDAIIAKVTADLEVLNIHRTPLNCITLLKVAEKSFDESPVNRTEMIKTILFILFNVEEIPTYKSRPDLKDCEYVLGFFCESLIKSTTNLFSRDFFLKEIKGFCVERVIDLEAELVFDVLHSNNIIVKRQTQYQFKFSYWIYYFGAHRMQQDSDFAKYIFENKKYIDFPEMIEFYTGIDRSREDALKILINDLRSTCNIVKDKVGLPDEMNPYRLINWRPTPEGIEKMKFEIGENVLSSNLPETVKDKYADRTYNSKRPYDQNIYSIMQEYSLVVLMQSIKASSRALRNSDYVKPDIKRELIHEIIRSWEQISKVLIALTPILAVKGNADFDGAAFTLFGDFGETVEERVNMIVQNIPFNVMYMFKNDLFSNKMGPLLFDTISNENNELKKHELVLLLIYERPRDWNSKVQDYIASISKNSFYLYDIYIALKVQYRYSFVAPKVILEIRFLIKMCIAKHQLGGIKPGVDMVKKIPDSVLPLREVKDES